MSAGGNIAYRLAGLFQLCVFTNKAAENKMDAALNLVDEYTVGANTNDADIQTRKKVLAARNVHKSYGDKEAVSGISINFYEGETTVLMGPNGAGKTTFMELLTGLIPPDKGSEITAFGKCIVKEPHCHIEKLGIQLQETRMFPRATPRDYINLFVSLYKKTLPLNEVVKWLGLEPFMDKQIKDLSGGMAQRVALAVAVINDPEIVLLDEPTVGLDPISRREFWECLKSLKKRNKTLIFNTHYMDEAVSLGDKIILLSNGRVVFQGTPDQVKVKAKTLEGGLDEAFEYYVNRSMEAASCI